LNPLGVVDNLKEMNEYSFIDGLDPRLTISRSVSTMRDSLLLIIFVQTLPAALPFAAPAQTALATPPRQVAGYSWERVESLPPGARMYVSARSNATCNFLRAGADSLTCTQGIGGNPLTVQRVDVRKVKLSRRGHSAGVGTGIGAGVGLVIGQIVGARNPAVGRGLGGGIGMFYGLIYGPIVGFFTDFTRSTIYLAP
jgi:hypothetical protein